MLKVIHFFAIFKENAGIHMSKMTYRLLQCNVEQGNFDCGVESINKFVYESYWATLLQHGYAYQIEYEGRIIGYYMITINHILLEECDEKISEYTSGLSSFIYTIEIKYSAIQEKFQGKKIGTAVLKSIIKSIKDYLYHIPFRLITIDARNDYIKWYESFGFIKCPVNSAGQDGYTTKMYLDCMLNEEKIKAYQDMFI